MSEPSHPTDEPLVKRYDCTQGKAQHCYGCYQMEESEYGDYVRWEDYERLRETLTCPRLTPDAPTDQFAAVLKDWEKGRPVNTQELVNALAWRLGNQRREISRLREQLSAEIKRQQDNCNV